MKNAFKYVGDGCDPKHASTMDELFGKKKQLNFPFKNKFELEAALNRMNLLDIQALAVQMGIKPTSDRRKLVRTCLDQYDRLFKTYGVAKITPKTDFDPSKI